MRWLLVLLVACGPRPTGPAATLRRHHAAGDVLRICERGDGVMSVSSTNDPITTSHRAIYDEHLLEVLPTHYSVRTDTERVLIQLRLGQQDVQRIEEGKRFGWIWKLDDRNRRLEHFTPKPVDNDPTRFSISLTPVLADFYDLAYPERGIRQNETFPLRVRRKVYSEDAVPTDLEVDAQFTVTRVEPDAIELACTGRQRQRASFGKEFAGSNIAIKCRARIDRRDGRTARWWFDTRATFETKQAPMGLLRSHYDVTVGDVEPGVCDRASE